MRFPSLAPCDSDGIQHNIVRDDLSGRKARALERTVVVLGRSRHGGRCPHENNDAVNAEMDLNLDLLKNELREALPA
jgi:hypothetical protein